MKAQLTQLTGLSKVKTILLYNDGRCVFHRCPSQKKNARRVCRYCL